MTTTIPPNEEDNNLVIEKDVIVDFIDKLWITFIKSKIDSTEKLSKIIEVIPKHIRIYFINNVFGINHDLVNLDLLASLIDSDTPLTGLFIARNSRLLQLSMPEAVRLNINVVELINTKKLPQRISVFMLLNTFFCLIFDCFLKMI